MNLSSAAFSRLLVQLPLLFVGYLVLRVFYNLFLHPLRSYPGPLLARATVITYQRKLAQGKAHLWIKELHDRYGPIVRVAPNELSYTNPQAWKDVYGHRSKFLKDRKFYGPDPYGPDAGLIRAGDVSHARQRKLVSHAFSDKALKDQETLFKTHVGLLLERLNENNRKVDLVSWFNFTTFDVMADLTFGESLGQLTASSYSPWVRATFGSVKMITLKRLCLEWPGFTSILNLFVATDVKEKRRLHLKFSAERVDKRMATETDRPDIWTFITKHNDDKSKSLSLSEMHNNSATFMVAGTETTATLLAGVTYLLLQNPEKLSRLTSEVRESFDSFDEIHMTKLNQLPYMQACLEEALRVYPPVPTGLRRVAPNPGVKVCGRWVPGGAMVAIPHYSMNRSPDNFTEPTKFVPERWLPEGQSKYGSDRKDALNPFSTGPRNCIGKNLAYHEMRLILASMILRFDMELCEETGEWNDQGTFLIWEKKPLLVNLKSVL